MPPKKTAIAKTTIATRKQRERRAAEAAEERESRLQENRGRASTSRAAETERERKSRLQQLRESASALRAAETPQQHVERLAANRSRMAQSRERIDLKLAAFHYNRDDDYRNYKDVVIGAMDKVCLHCHALKFAKESPGMCCSNGKVVLPTMIEPPEPLQSYISGAHPISKHFLQNIRNYNSCFQMTSFGATNIINNAGYMPTFKVQGQIYHRIGSLLPLPNDDAKFLQIYFTGNEAAEVEQRCAISTEVRREIVSSLQAMLHEHNSLIRLFKTALDQMPADDYTVVIRADKTPAGEHERRFNAPVIGDVAVVMVGTDFERRDIIIHRRNASVQRIAETHRSYDALQYPVLFPLGEDGYHFNVMQINPNSNGESTKKVSCMDFYAYRLMIRPNECNYLLKCREVFHQFIVDMYAKIESERLLFIRLNQQKLRVEEYVHLRDAIANDGNAANIGQMVILPATYTGSPRHMHQYAQDAMTYVRKYGRPDLFITFTCNPAWKDITDLLFTGQSSTHRHDILARVFKQKLTRLMDVITKNHIFGETLCWMYSVEWQKRGLPHAHVLVWLKQKIMPTQIDDVISAELPNPTADPVLFESIRKHMIHGPCGELNSNSPCMKEGKCTKRYPREMIQETQTGGDGYPLYRRRKVNNGGYTTTIKMRNLDVDVDNRWIVPYSPLLSKMFDAHINVEYCNSVKSIKYICKYVNKGSDMAVFGLTNQTDEITQFQMGRYISSNEAVWRILSFNIHERYPTVQHLAVHLENGQRVYFTERNAANRAEQPPHTTLTAFFELCATDNFAKTLIYPEIPKYYTWSASSKKFTRRKRGTIVAGYAGVHSSDALGRVYTVHPNNAECYYLRLLLHTIKGPTSFAALKTIHGNECQTYREACFRLGLLESDQHWNTTLTEASLTCHPKQIRTLFAIILTTCSPSNPRELWETHRESLGEDILRQSRATYPNQEYSDEIFNQTLLLIEDMCISINNKLLIQLGMPAPIRDMNSVHDRDLVREQHFDVNQQQQYVEAQTRLLVDDQKTAYAKIMQRVTNGNGGLFFLDAPGGTGKTFLINLILASVRMQSCIALAVASSGIASTLLDGGRTAHSALKLPLNLNQTEAPTCNISKNSGMATILKTCKIIVWDECTMAHKKLLEALDRTLRDFRGNNQPMGGALILLAGDFRQTLPVIPRSMPADELNACLKASYLWNRVEKITLSTNMRVHLLQDPSAKTFSKQLLDIGNGKIPINRATNEISFPPKFLSNGNEYSSRCRQGIPKSNKLLQKFGLAVRTCNFGTKK